MKSSTVRQSFDKRAILITFGIDRLGLDTHGWSPVRPRWVLSQILLFPGDGVHAVTSALSQINCNIVSVAEEIRYVAITA